MYMLKPPSLLGKSGPSPKGATWYKVAPRVHNLFQNRAYLYEITVG